MLTKIKTKGWEKRLIDTVGLILKADTTMSRFLALLKTFKTGRVQSVLTNPSLYILRYLKCRLMLFFNILKKHSWGFYHSSKKKSLFYLTEKEWMIYKTEILEAKET